MRFKTVAVVLFSFLRLFLYKSILQKRLIFHPLQSHSPFMRLHVGKSASMRFGRNTTLSYGVDLCAVEQGRIEIADGVYLGPRCMLSSHASITVGTNCLFGPDVKIFDNNHALQANHGVIHGKHVSEHVSIGNNCWLGANVIVLKGVKIGDGCVVGAGCIVNKNLPAGSLTTSGVALRTVPIVSRLI